MCAAGLVTAAGPVSKVRARTVGGSVLSLSLGSLATSLGEGDFALLDEDWLMSPGLWPCSWTLVQAGLWKDPPGALLCPPCSQQGWGMGRVCQFLPDEEREAQREGERWRPGQTHPGNEGFFNLFF